MKVKSTNLNTFSKLGAMGESNWKKLDEEHEAPMELKKNIQRSVFSNLNFLRFFGSVVDLYVGKVSETIVGLTNTFQNEEQETPPSIEDEDKSSHS